MFIFLFLLCVPGVLPVCSTYDGMCPRKDPPPGVVVVSPGSRLVLTCSGQVKVNGVKVVLNSSNINNRRPKSDQSSEHEENLTGSDVSPLTLHPTSESDWEDAKLDGDDDYDEEEEEEEEGSRVTRGTKLRPQWKWNKQLVQKGDRNRGEVTFMSHGAALSLESVRMMDAGKYSCHHRGTETFAVTVVVADPPESPRLSCYKKSPISKVRCEWRPQKPSARPPSCYLFLSKRSEDFQRVLCSFSSDRCWCALEYNENEYRVLHVAFLCVTSIVGNATSPPLYFKPMNILKPDPPSNISAHQVEREEKMIKVTWSFPLTWNLKDNFFQIMYEIRYRPSTSANNQGKEIGYSHSFTITNALPGDEYLIQLRSKEEYDGQWSEWSSPVYARSWTDGLSRTPTVGASTFDSTTSTEGGSGFADDSYSDVTGPKNESGSDDPVEMLNHVVWVSGLLAFLIAVVLTVYKFRHKDKLMSKLCLITHCGDVPPPSPPTPAAPEDQDLMTFVPQPHKEQLLSDTQEEEENEEEQAVTGRTGAMNFNNTSYFFL